MSVMQLGAFMSLRASCSEGLGSLLSYCRQQEEFSALGPLAHIMLNGLCGVSG